MCAFVHVCLCAYVCTYVPMCMCQCVCLCVSVQCMCVYLYMCLCVCLCMCLCVCLFVCGCVCVCLLQGSYLRANTYSFPLRGCLGTHPHHDEGDALCPFTNLSKVQGGRRRRGKGMAYRLFSLISESFVSDEWFSDHPSTSHLRHLCSPWHRRAGASQGKVSGWHQDEAGKILNEGWRCMHGGGCMQHHTSTESTAHAS